MKLLLSGNFNRGSNDTFFLKAFAEIGLEVDFFNEQYVYDKSLDFFSLKNSYVRKILNRIFWSILAYKVQSEFISKVEEFKPEKVLILKGYYIKPKTLMNVKRRGIHLSCFNPDNPFNTWHRGISNFWIKKSISIYDIYFIWGKFLIEKLYEAGAKKVFYLPFAFDPDFLSPRERSSNLKAEVAFVGSWDEERENWINGILDFDLKIWGNSWEKASKRVKEKWQKKEAIGEDFAAVCSSSLIMLNFIRKQNGNSHNMRTFEIPACGGLMLSNRTIEQAEFFREGIEADYFSSLEELRRKIGFYIKNQEKVKEIQKNAFKAAKKHSFKERARYIFNLIQWKKD